MFKQESTFENMGRLEDISLTLFFSGGVSLGTWSANGSLHREALLYKKLAYQLKKVNFITYGGKSDRRLQGELEGINICPSAWLRRPHRFHRYLMPLNLILTLLANKNVFVATDVIKTNQISGSEIAVFISKLYKKKLLIRCGYVPSRLLALAEKEGAGSAVISNLKRLALSERYAFSNADMIIVPTEKDRIWVSELYGVNADKINVVPNYVDTTMFAPITGTKKIYDLVFVGRSSPEKNINGIVEALSLLKKNGLKYSILFVGSCGESEEVKDAIKSGKIDGFSIGNVENRQLPAVLSSAKAFIITSFYEGNSKALLEAMSSAMPCICTDVDSMNTVISHRKNGYLCKTDSKNIADAIRTVLGNLDQMRDVGREAREYVLERFDIEKVFKIELDLIKKLC